MPNMSNELENKLLDFLFRGQPFPQIQSIYVAMFTTKPTDAEPGAEPAAPSYGRAAITCNLNAWSATNAPDSRAVSTGSSGTTYNIEEIKFPDPEQDWGNIRYIGLFDAPAGGTYLYWSELTNPRDFIIGDVNIKFRAGELSVQIDN
ncbi:hypothetical protein FACS1894216_01280 [Synergistales bacterium]|nr:hypothetical protein FACS1894216_01280 [Synergistales bacterium]